MVLSWCKSSGLKLLFNGKHHYLHAGVNSCETLSASTLNVKAMFAEICMLKKPLFVINISLWLDSNLNDLF